MAELKLPMPDRVKEEQSKVPPLLSTPVPQMSRVNDQPLPQKKPVTPFKFNKDGQPMVSKEFMETYRGQLQEEAQKAGLESPEQYLQKVLQGAIERQGKWSGKSIKEAGVVKWSPEAEAKAAAIAKNHGMTTEEFKAIVKHESAGTMAPDVVNSIGATGIIQFMPSTAASYLLMEQRAHAIETAKTPEEKELAKKKNPLYWQLSPAQQKKAQEWGQKTIANLPVERQLDLVDLYITDRAKGTKGYENVYTAIFAGNPDQKEFKQGTAAYANNKALDKNSDGKITRGEWTQPVANKVEKQAANSRDPEHTSEEEVDRMKSRAEKVLKLAMPNKSREDISTATTVVPARVTVPGTAEQEELAKRNAGGLYWPQDSRQGEQVWVTKSMPKPVATGVLAHEYGHALGAEDSGKGQQQKARFLTGADGKPVLLSENVTYGSTPINAVDPEGRTVNVPRGGLMHWSGEEAGLTQGWAGVVKAAADMGGAELNQQQAEEENSLFDKLPSWLASPVKKLIGFEEAQPSKSFDYETMRQASGESPIELEEWQKNGS